MLETGHDILYQWVARMIMLGIYSTGKVPFKDVYLHGLVLDEHGQKMSKSKGNVVNPMEILAEHGSDALRFGLISSRGAGQNQAFATSKVIAGRNFCNKLWNISRFILDKLGEDYAPAAPKPATVADHWIVHELNQASDDIEQQITNYRFAEASEAVYHAIWDNVADWYIEASKADINPDILAWVLETSLRLAHPFAPFVTETIWQTLPWTDSLLILEHWPTPLECDDISAGEFTRVQALVAEARYVMSELPGNKRYPLLFQQDTLIEENAALIKQLSRVSDVASVDQARGLRLAASGREAWLDIDEDTLYEHQTNLEVRLAETRAKKQTLEARLANENYVAKAPAHLVEETKQELEATATLIAQLATELDVLN